MVWNHCPRSIEYAHDIKHIPRLAVSASTAGSATPLALGCNGTLSSVAFTATRSVAVLSRRHRHFTTLPKIPPCQPPYLYTHAGSQLTPGCDGNTLDTADSVAPFAVLRTAAVAIRHGTADQRGFVTHPARCLTNGTAYHRSEDRVLHATHRSFWKPSSPGSLLRLNGVAVVSKVYLPAKAPLFLCNRLGYATGL